MNEGHSPATIVRAVVGRDERPRSSAMRLDGGWVWVQRMAEATPSGRGILDMMNRIYRIEEDMSHARLTLHAASALKAQRRQGRGIEDP